MDLKAIFILAILVLSGTTMVGCLEDDDRPWIEIINRPFLNMTSSNIHLEPGEEWEFDFWWETEGRQEWPKETEIEFILNNSRRVGRLEGYGQVDNISVDKWEPSLKYTAFENMVGFEKIDFKIIIFYHDEYFNTSGNVKIYVETEFMDIPIKTHDRYYRKIEEFAGKIEDDHGRFKAQGYFTWPDMEGCEYYEMTVYFNGNDPGLMFWKDEPFEYVYTEGFMYKQYRVSNQMPEGELKGWKVGLEEYKDEYLVMMGGPTIDFEDGQWEQADIDSIIAENRTKTQDYFNGWTCNIKAVPDDSWF